MKLTDLQFRILAKMHLDPMAGIDIKHAVGHAGTDRTFANALMRMRDRGLIEVAGEVGAIAYKPTPAGLGAFLDAAAALTASEGPKP